MRIIAQNGLYDIPYHCNCIGIKRIDERFYLVCHYIDGCIGLGDFSTEERAKEELQHIRDAYENNHTMYYVVKGE